MMGMVSGSGSEASTLTQPHHRPMPRSWPVRPLSTYKRLPKFNQQNQKPTNMPSPQNNPHQTHKTPLERIVNISLQQKTNPSTSHLTSTSLIGIPLLPGLTSIGGNSSPLKAPFRTSNQRSQPLPLVSIKDL